MPREKCSNRLAWGSRLTRSYRPQASHLICRTFAIVHLALCHHSSGQTFKQVFIKRKYFEWWVHWRYIASCQRWIEAKLQRIQHSDLRRPCRWGWSREPWSRVLARDVVIKILCLTTFELRRGVAQNFWRLEKAKETVAAKLSWLTD